MTRRISQNNISRLTRESSQSNRSSRRPPEAKNSSSPRLSTAKVARKTSSSPSPTSQPNKKTTVAVPAQKARLRDRRKPPSPIFTLLLYLIRLSILGVGLGAIAGTVLTIIKPSQVSLPLSQETPTNTTQTASAATTQETSNPLSLSQELPSLKAKIDALAVKYPKLQPGAFFVDLDNGAYVSVQGETVFSAASTIKIPVLIAFFQDVDAGKIRLDEMLAMKKELIASGSGDMQYQKPDTQFTALQTATKMSVISDNTATNMIIERLGGKEALNQRFREWGLTSTVINNSLPDLEGKNTSSPKDLAHLLAKVNQGELVSLVSRDRILRIMQDTRTQTLLPQGLEKDAIIAHKTGDIGSVLGDAGIIDMPSGKRYIGSVFVKRPHNDYSARTLIQEISRTVYQHFKWYQVRPAAPITAASQSSESTSE